MSAAAPPRMPTIAPESKAQPVQHALSAPDAPSVRAAEPARVAHGTANGPTVMVVEDDPAIREMLVRSLAAHYRVYEASDGQEALDALQRYDAPDLLVLDVMMPRMDGLTLARALKGEAKTRAIPIIFLTGLDSAKDVVQGINAGARHYLTKPFKIQDLLGKVGKVLGKRN
jgi:DNA-binding response OmpR family regulator